MKTPKEDVLKAALIKLRDNLNSDYLERLQQERHLSGTMEDLINNTLKAIVKHDDLSEDAAEAFNVLLSLSYLEGYSQREKIAAKQEAENVATKAINKIRRKK